MGIEEKDRPRPESLEGESVEREQGLKL